MTRRTLKTIAWALATAVLIFGCSSDKTPPTLPGAHPTTWMNKTSPDFHGQVVLANGTESCAHCHGIETSDGRVDISCMDCHGPGTDGCLFCHGGIDNNTSAPPVGLRGETATTILGVGAHTAHLDTTSLGAPVPCDACHVVPVYFLSPPHLDQDRPAGEPLDSIAEIVWGGIADGGAAAWDHAAGTCANTYCHGNFSGGDAGNTPVWNGAGQAACGSCHDVGSDPDQLGWKHEYHVDTVGLFCGDCHFSVVDTLLTITNPALHVNGLVDTLIRDPALCAACHGSGPAECTACHGGTDNTTGAPPEGLRGETATTDLGVGAHTIHLDGGDAADGFDCAECHIVPASMLDPGHLDVDYIAEITWGPLAGAASQWSRGTATCSGVYCHGNFAGGDAANSPVWTASGQAGCGSCHDVGSDPASLLWEHEYHIDTAGLDCGDCHANVVDMQFNIVGTALHVNGVADTLTRDPSLCAACHGSGPAACTTCHGGSDNMTGAPPVGLEGETSTTDLAVGAHTIHLDGGATADAFECVECHVVPASLSTPGHRDGDDIAELIWGPLAGAASQWSRGTATCSGVYCHGNFAGGDAVNSPVWTASGQAGCGSCHDVGSDPASLEWKHELHVGNFGLDCGECHASVVDMQLTITGLDLHVNGIVDTLTRDPSVCAACHGSGPVRCVDCHGGIDNFTGAPPLGLEGETSTNDLAVGAHTTHMEGGSLADAFACEECHSVPVAIADPGHIDVDYIAEMSWGALAGQASAWSRGAATCSNVYCHGEFSGGAGSNSPVWTGSGQAGCGSCHDVGTNPRSLSGEHDKHIRDKGLDCIECHSTVVSRQMVILNTALHVDGNLTVSILKGGTYQNGSCSGLNNATCHGDETWFDTR